MKKIQRIALGLALLATLAGAGSGASAKSGSPRRSLSGTVQSIDLRARTVEVRDQETGRIITVRVPDGTLIRTNSTNEPVVQIERLLPGMLVTAIVR